MFTVLDRLNKTVGIRGSMIVGRDGIVIASDFGVDVDEPAIGAVASSILSSLEDALRRMNMGQFMRFVITGSENKIALVDARRALLMVLLDREVNLGLVSVEIKDAVDAVIEKGQL